MFRFWHRSRPTGGKGSENQAAKKLNHQRLSDRRKCQGLNFKVDTTVENLVQGAAPWNKYRELHNVEEMPGSKTLPISLHAAFLSCLIPQNSAAMSYEVHIYLLQRSADAFHNALKTQKFQR